MSNSLRTIVVLESRPRWEPELQRQFADEQVRVRGCRTVNELASLVFPTASTVSAGIAKIADTVVLQIPENAAACLQWITSLAARPQAPAVIVLCMAESSELEWSLRDAGVSEVLIDEHSGERLARSCRRQWLSP